MLELLIVKLHFSFLPPPAADCDVWFYFSHNQSLPAAAELPSKHILCSSCCWCLSFLASCPRWSDFLLYVSDGVGLIPYWWPNLNIPWRSVHKCSLSLSVLRVAIWRGILSTQQGEISAFYCFSQLCIGIVQSNLNFWRKFNSKESHFLNIISLLHHNNSACSFPSLKIKQSRSSFILVESNSSFVHIYDTQRMQTSSYCPYNYSILTVRTLFVWHY